MILMNKFISKILVGTSNAIGAMTLVIIGYFAFISEADYKYVFAFLSCVGFVPAYLVYRLAMRFYDGV